MIVRNSIGLTLAVLVVLGGWLAVDTVHIFRAADRYTAQDAARDLAEIQGQLKAIELEASE